MREQLPQRPVIEQTKQERIAIPTIEEMRATENPFTDHARLVSNVLQLTILELISSRERYNGELTLSPQTIKNFLQSQRAPDKNFVAALSFIDEYYDAEGQRPQLSPTEQTRTLEAITEHRQMPRCTKPSDPKEVAVWVPTAPVIVTSGAGTQLTNIYWDDASQSMTIADVEPRTTRINLAVEPTIGERRVLQDLYKKLCANELLQKTGFRMKSLGSRRTDSIIIYCGDKGASAALAEVARYCLDENIGNVPGIAFGLTPFRKDGETTLNGLRVTDHPTSDRGTFNDIQAIALHAAFMNFVDTALAQWAPGTTFGNANLDQLQRLLADVRSERPSSLALMIQNTHEDAIRAQLDMGSSEKPIWNVAFPAYQPPEEAL